MVRRVSSGKEPIQIDVPSQENQDTSGSVKHIKEGVPNKIVRKGSGYDSEKGRKSISDYKVDTVDLKEPSDSFLSPKEVVDPAILNPNNNEKSVVSLGEELIPKEQEGGETGAGETADTVISNLDNNKKSVAPSGEELTSKEQEGGETGAGESADTVISNLNNNKKSVAPSGEELTSKEQEGGETGAGEPADIVISNLDNNKKSVAPSGEELTSKEQEGGETGAGESADTVISNLNHNKKSVAPSDEEVTSKEQEGGETGAGESADTVISNLNHNKKSVAPSDEELTYKEQEGGETGAGEPADIVISNLNTNEVPTVSHSLSDKPQRLIRVYDKDVVHRMTSQLLQRAVKFMSGYSLSSHLRSLNIKHAINAFDKNELMAAGELFEKLDDFALLLANNEEKKLELSAHKKGDQAQIEAEYNALASSFNLLKDVVKDIHYDNLTRECKQKLRDAFSRFENPGEESLLRARAQVGIDVNIAKMDAGVEVSTQLVGCDDTKIRLFKNQKVTQRLTVGVDLAKGYVTGTVGEIKGRVFNSIDEFIDYCGDSFLLVLHGKKKPTMSVWRENAEIKGSITQIKEGMALKKRIIQNVSRLEQQLKKLELDIVQEGSLKYGSSAKRVPLMIKREVAEKQVGVRVLNAIGLDYVHTKWKNTFTKKAPILAQLKKYPEWCNGYDNSYFNMAIARDREGYINRLDFQYGGNVDRGFAEGGVVLYKGGQVIPLLSNRLEVLKGAANQKQNGELLQGGVVAKELSEMQSEVLQLIEQNYQEYKIFCDLSNAKKTSKSKKLDPVVAQLMEQRGAKKEPEMLQRLMVGHAKLSNIYRQAGQFLNRSETTDAYLERLECIEQDLSVPDIAISQKEMENYLMLNKELHGSAEFKDAIVRVMLGPFEGLADVRYIKNRNEPNPDSDGDYLFIVFRGSIVGNASLAESSIVESLSKLMGTLPSIDAEAPIMIEAASEIELVLQGAKHLKMELSFVKGDDGCYHEQYKRLLSGEEFAAKGGGKAPIFGGGSLSGQVAVDHCAYHFLGEELGTDTISYVQTRYNGWKMGNKPEKWDAFLEDRKNRIRLAKIMVNMAIEGGNAGNEFRFMKKGIKEYYQAICDSRESSEVEKGKAQAIVDKLYSEKWEASFSNLKKLYTTYYNSTTLPAESELGKGMKSATKRVLTEKYEALVEETNLNDREKFALESVVDTAAFTFAIRVFQEVLEDCHAPYLQEAASRAKDVNPNQPVPYKKA